jgi:bifunctional lysine-specific demethylase and histidyl-hydroxylase NO66
MTLDDLLSPLGAAAFFADRWERAPLHLPGDPARGAALCSHAALVEALKGADEVPEGLLAFPEHFDPGLGAAELLRDPEKLHAYLDAGHPIVWNRARGIFPAVDALAELLSESLGAHVWPNVYATGEAGTPFDAHFDAHEVIAVQCEGQKRWWLSEVRVDRPLDVREMEAAVEHALRARREEALARTALEFTVGPGDVVYVPRGQFHNASAAGGRSLHVTFGIRLPSGFDALKQLVGEALGDAALREYLPPIAADPDGERATREAETIAERAREMITAESVAGALGALRRRLVARSRRPT